MKQHLRGITAALTALVLGLTVLSGCRSAVMAGDKATAAVLQGEEYSLEEAKLYIYASQYMIEQDSEVIISYMYQSYDAFWEYEQNGQSYYQMNYIEGLNKLFQTKRLVKKAAADGIALTDEEKQKVEDAIVKFKEEEKNVVAASGCSEELLRQFVTENAIAQKTYLAMIADVDTTFDEAEFRRKNVEGLYVTALTEKPAAEAESTAESSEETAESTEAAEPETYTEEEQKAAREEAVTVIETRLKAGESVSDILASFEGSETVRVTSTGALTLSPEDAAEEGAEITSYRQLGWTMSTDDVETFESTASTGSVTTYILRCVNDDDPDLRASAEKSELVSRKNKLFGERYQELLKQYPDYHVYEEVVNTIKKVIPMYESEMMTQQESAAE